MADDEHTRIMWGAIIAAVTGLYAFFVKHLIAHPSKNEIDRLRDSAQYKDNCAEIVKRIDEKLDTIIMHVEKKDA